MPQQIRRFTVRQTAKVVGVLDAIIGLLLVPLFLIAAMVSPDEKGFSIGFTLALPILYGIGGFIFTALACELYNVVARKVGGIEVELE